MSFIVPDGNFFLLHMQYIYAICILVDGVLAYTLNIFSEFLLENPYQISHMMRVTMNTIMRRSWEMTRLSILTT